MSTQAFDPGGLPEGLLAQHGIGAVVGKPVVDFAAFTDLLVANARTRVGISIESE